MKQITVKLYALLLGIIVLQFSYVYADEELVNVSTTKNVAIHGYDTVAYFIQGEPVQGQQAFAHDHLGTTWLFSSQANLDLFTEDPDKYTPQYGGFCAYAASQGARADIDPIAWRIIDGKLYLNYDLRVQKVWAGSLDEHISAADEFWSEQMQ